MKKVLSLILAVTFLLTLAGCNTSADGLFTKKDGKTYLVLPDSKAEVYFPDEYEKYSDEIDAELLKTAEKKIRDEASEYTDDIKFNLQDYDDELYLYTEFIVELDPSETTDDECGDHNHMTYRERITK